MGGNSSFVKKSVLDYQLAEIDFLSCSNQSVLQTLMQPNQYKRPPASRDLYTDEKKFSSSFRQSFFSTVRS